MEDYARGGMVDSLQCSRPEPTQYLPPEKLDKMYALYVVNTMNLTASAKAVATILIGYANKTTGRCDPGQARIARGAGIAPRTVKRAVQELLRTRVLVRRTRRANASNAYQLNWPALRVKFADMESRMAAGTGMSPREEQDEEPRGQGCHFHGDKDGPSVGTEMSPKHWNEPFNKNIGPERSHSPDGAPLLSFENPRSRKAADPLPDDRLNEFSNGTRLHIEPKSTDTAVLRALLEKKLMGNPRHETSHVHETSRVHGLEKRTPGHLRAANYIGREIDGER